MVGQSSETVLGRCGLKPLVSRRKFLDLVFMDKSLKGHIYCPNFLLRIKFKESSYNLTIILFKKQNAVRYSIC